MENLLKSSIHTDTCRMNRLKILSKSEFNQKSSAIDSKISKSQIVLFRKIGSNMITIFNDAKRGNLSIWSWPPREVAFQRGKHFLENETIHGLSENLQDFRYLFPASHAEISEFILKAAANQNEQHFERMPGDLIED